MPGEPMRSATGWVASLLLPLAACGAVAVTPKEAAPPGPPLLTGVQPPSTVAQLAPTTTLTGFGKWGETEQAVADCLDMFHVPGRVGTGSVDLSLLLTQVANGNLTALSKATRNCALAQRFVVRKYGATSPEASKMASMTALLAETKQARDDDLLPNASALAFTSLLTQYHKAFGEVVGLISQQ